MFSAPPPCLFLVVFPPSPFSETEPMFWTIKDKIFVIVVLFCSFSDILSSLPFCLHTEAWQPKASSKVVTGWSLSGQGGAVSFWSGKLSQKIGKRIYCCNVSFSCSLLPVRTYLWRSRQIYKPMGWRGRWSRSGGQKVCLLFRFYLFFLFFFLLSFFSNFPLLSLEKES